MKISRQGVDRNVQFSLISDRDQNDQFPRKKKIYQDEYGDIDRRISVVA